MASRTLVIKTKMDNTEYNAQIKQLQTRINDLTTDIQENANTPLMSNSELEKSQAELEKLTNQLNKLKQKQEEIDDTGVKFNFDNLGQGLEKSVKSVGKMVLALFSVRTAMSLISRATSIVSENNEDLANQIESIKYTLAMAIEPIITRIVGWVQTLIQYVGYLAKEWFDVDLFANASAKASEKNAKGISKTAKEMKKMIAGFDEMNTVSDNSSSSSGADTGGIGSIQALPDGEIPEWLVWIKDNGELLASILTGIAVGIVAIKLGLEGVQALGIGAIVTGVCMLLSDIVEMIQDPSWSNFIAILGDIAIVIGGIMLVMGNWWGLLIVIIGAVVKLIADNWETIKETLGKIGGWIWDHVISPVVNFIKSEAEHVKNTLHNTVEDVKNKFSSLKEFISNIAKAIGNFFSNLWSGLKSGASAVGNSISSAFTKAKENIIKAFQQVKTTVSNIMNAIWTAVKSPLNLIITGINKLISGINKISFDVPDWVPVIGGKKWGFDIPSIPKLALGGIVNNPGHGVNIGGAIAGERGQEAVLPLTNGEVMQQLGEAIGKYITVNLTNNTQLDGRTIARQMNKINQNRAFGSNS